ncbi:hypothetical protein CALCODRAFT_18019 [Calocera cornea HHB12733]|uniref:Uncharacterized protein n=1 Tax=Calocera cornea HHB12733 TaxID=1353952 RepID=A0A165E816_9BASI|nr:hypothetical protein CALCODRAFT_18019 [Calocera cornea HHB12733]
MTEVAEVPPPPNSFLDTTRKTSVLHELVELLKVYCQTWATVEGPKRYKKLLPRDAVTYFNPVSFEDLGASVATSVSCKILKNRDLAKVGEWDVQGKPIKMTLLICGQPLSPFDPLATSPDLVLLVERKVHSSKHIQMELKTDVRLHLSLLEPMSAINFAGGHDPYKVSLGGSSWRFNERIGAQACVLDRDA